MMHVETVSLHWFIELTPEQQSEMVDRHLESRPFGLTGMQFLRTYEIVEIWKKEHREDVAKINKIINILKDVLKMN